MVLRAHLFTRLIILVVAATLPAVLVLLYLQHDMRRDRLTHLADDAVRQAEMVELDLRNLLEGARQFAMAVSHFVAQPTPRRPCAEDLRSFQRDLPGYAAVSVRDAAGAVLCSSAAPVGSDVPLDQGFGDAPAPVAGKVQVGLFVPATDARGPVVPVRLGFTGADGTTGWVVVELGLDWLARHTAGLRLPDRSTVGIADRNGTTLVRVPDHARFVGRKLPDGVMPLVATTTRGNATVVGFDGRERLLGYVPPGELGVFVSIGLFKPDMLADIDAAAWRGLVLIGLGALLSLALALLAGNRFVRRPTAALLDAAGRWSNGDLQARARLHEAAGSEFGKLATAFNNMAEALGRRRSEMEELNTTLEARVKARTRDVMDSRNRLQIEVAERERTEAELRQAQKLQAVGQLAGGIAHDFNNLLTAIIGALDLLRRRLPEGQHSLVPLVENALHAAERGGRLTGQLLAFSRRQRLLPVPTDLNVSVLVLTGLLGSTLGRNIRIETDLAADLWPAMVDPNQVESVILNLAINARDAMEGDGLLTIMTRNLTLPAGSPGNAAPGDYVALRVSDTGSGIPPEVMARVFEPFFTTKKLGEGTGLGLSQVHGLAVQSGGDVRIESQEGQGTSVTVLLPRALVEPSAANQPSALHPNLEPRLPGESAADEAASLAGPVLPRRSLRVLVVDDDRPVREMTGEMLIERGHQVVLARDAAEALALLERARDGLVPAFDVMLADYVMPGMNGVGLMRAAQALCPGLRALLVTGNAEFHAAEAVRPEDIMRKPFTIAQLEERMGRMVAAAALQVELRDAN